MNAINSAPLVVNPPVWKRVLQSEYLVLILSVLYFSLFAFTTRKYFSPANFQNIFSNMLPLLVVAAGQTVVLITGGIDLSITSVIALCSVFGATAMTADQGLLAGSSLAAPAGVIVMLALGTGLGALNGLAITWLKMPPFIVTLTTLMFFRGLAIWFTQSQNISRLPDCFIMLGRDFWPPIITLLVLLAIWVLLNRTVIGRWIYAVGHNLKTGLISGVPVNRTLLTAYIISGACAGIASVLYSARLGNGSPTIREPSNLLDIVGAVVIGGTSLFGGKGSVVWTVYGVLFITLIDNSLNMRGLSDFMIMIVKGSVILLAALIDVWRTRLAQRG